MANGSMTRRGDPFGGLTSLHSQLDDVFSDLFSSDLPAINTNFPAMDVYAEDDNRLVVEVNLAGFNPEDIEIHVHDDVLEIMGEKEVREEDRDRRNRNYMIREAMSTFFRSIRLPKYADGDNIEATFENGILRIMVPFQQERSAQRVQIRGMGRGNTASGAGRTTRASARNGSRASGGSTTRRTSSKSDSRTAKR